MKTLLLVCTGLMLILIGNADVPRAAEPPIDPAESAPAEHFRYGGVTVDSAPSWLGVGQVVTFKNQDSTALTNCYFAVEGSRNQRERTHYGPIRIADAMKPGKTLKVGWWELGKQWLLLPGDVVYLRCDNLPESKWTLPATR